MVRLVSPPTARVTADAASVIEIDLGAYRGPVVLVLDGRDVTAFAERDGTLLRYRPSPALTLGEHRVQVLTVDVAQPEASWILTVAPSEAGATAARELYGRGGVSLSGNVVVRDKQADPASVTGNLAPDVGVASAERGANLSGNVAYSNAGAADRFTLSNYLLTLTDGPGKLALGDVSIKATPLTAPSLARRGLLATVQQPATQWQAFQVNSNTVTGFNSGLDYSDANDQIYGTAITHRFGETREAFELSAAFLSGELGKPNASNVSTTEPPRRGKAASVLGRGSAFGAGLSGEAGWSDFDADTGDGQHGRRDKAFTFQLGRPIAGIQLGLNYFYAGPDFASVGNPNGTRDRRQLGVTAGTGFGISSLSASLSRSNDNVDRDTARPVVVNESVGLTYSVAPADWPNATLSYVQGRLYSHSESAGDPSTDKTSDMLGLALAYSRPSWSTNLSWSVGKIDDARDSSQDSRATSQQLALNLAPSGSGLTLASSLGLTETDTAGTTQQGRLAAFTLGYAISQELTLNGQVSLGENKTQDGTTDVRQQAAALRLNWNLRRLAARWLFGQQASLSLTVTHNNVNDRITPANDRDSMVVFAGLNIYAPYDWRRGF